MIAVISCGHKPDDERVYVREVKSLIKAGHKITYFTRWEKEANLSEEKLWHRNYSEKGLSIKEYTKGILNDFKVLKPQAIHIHEFELLPLAKKAKKLYNCKIIYDVHEANIELWDAFSSKPTGVKKVVNKALEQFEKKYLNIVDTVLTTTLILVERYKEQGIKSYLLPNYPIDLPRRSKKSSTTTIIYHGQISIERGLVDLVKAIPAVSDAHKSFRLEIYGDERVPGTVSELNELIKELNISDVINIYDAVPHKEMLSILSKAHIEVIPFHDNPMFNIAIPVKLFEAMWAKCAIVSSELDSIKQIDDGFIEFITPGNIDELSSKLIHLLNNPKEIATKGDTGAKLIKQIYNWEKVEHTLLEAYKDFKD